MSSKFFTWTKGDRRNASEALRSGGVVPIPVECLTIKGMDYTRSSKGQHRKPLPLTLNQDGFTTPSRSSRTSDSIALHDAAVQSATSLMAVMNDMLRSPQLSAHWSSRPQDPLPSYTRPRSHTAPSTPLLEAPAREPAELPGSFPLDVVSTKLSLPPKNASDPALARVHDFTASGASIPRPHSSPQEKHFNTQFAASLVSPTLLQGDKLPHCGTVPPQAQLVGPNPSLNEHNADAAPAGLAPSFRSDIGPTRPKLSCVQAARYESPCPTESTTSSQRGSSTVVPRATGVVGRPDNDDHEDALLQEIARLRASQEAHLSSLKEAHEKELASHKNYISFLEKRKLSATPNQQQQQKLTLDTSQSGTSRDLCSEPSATTLRSFESPLEEKKRVSHDSTAEAETLRRKLSLCAKTQVDAVEVQRERDELRRATDRSDRRIAQLKEIVRKAKATEKALRNQATNLEARLVDANNERLDVLEGFDDACSQVRAANDRESRLAKRLDAIRMTESMQTSSAMPSLDAPPQSTRMKHQRTVSDASTLPALPRRMDPTTRQLIEARRTIVSQDERIKQLELAVSEAMDKSSSYGAMHAQIADLRTQLEQQSASLSVAQSDSERYNSLLHNELRRQARTAARHIENLAPQIEGEAFTVASEKMVRLRSRAGTTGAHDATSAPLPVEPSAAALAAMLEKELDHCIKEIILYKLDIKGYRKDLKKANLEIDNLRAMGINCPLTPDRDSLSSDRSQRGGNSVGANEAEGKNPRAHTEPNDSGLGICLPQAPKTPTKQSAVAAAAAAALSPPLTSPPLRTKTPLNTHKRLPKPPAASRTPSPPPLATRSKWPEQDIARTQTLRSLSESIISSYGKRGQMQSEPGSGGNLSEFRSDPIPPGTPGFTDGMQARCTVTATL